MVPFSTFAHEDSGPHISVAAGITIGLIAASIQSLGMTIQRKSHVLNQEAPESSQRKEYRRPLWLLGFGIFITSNILGSVFQIASLPVVILAPLGAVSLLWNALFARLILGDLFSRFMVIGTILIVAGAVLIARFGIIPEPTHDLEDLLALFRRDTFVVYFSLLGAALAIGLIATHLLEWSVKRRIERDSSPTASMLLDTSQPASPAPIPLTPTTERTPLLASQNRKLSPSPSPSSDSSSIPSVLIKYRPTLNLIASSYAAASGILSGMCLLFAKSGVELLLLSITGGKNQFYRWESWALVGGLVVFALLQLWYLHKSLVLADPTLVCPVAFCFYNLSSIVNGLIYYDQLNVLSPTQLGLVITGIVVLLAGVWAVSIQADDDEPAGVKEGDWINADEAGIAPAVAPADVVRVVERAAGADTLPKDWKLNVQAPTTDTEDEPTHLEDRAASPATRGRRTKNLQLNLGRRTQTVPTPKTPRSVSSPTQLPPSTSSTLFPTSADDRHPAGDPDPSPRPTSFPTPSPNARRRSLQSPTTPLATLPPGFSIGLSAVSPGFGVPATRRRTEAGFSPNPRRSVSMSGDIRGYGSVPETDDTRSEVGSSSRWTWLTGALTWTHIRRKSSEP